jgi:hypothetical protein
VRQEEPLAVGEGEEGGSLLLPAWAVAGKSRIIPRDAVGRSSPGQGERRTSRAEGVLSHLLLMSFVDRFFNRLIQYSDTAKSSFQSGFLWGFRASNFSRVF